MLSSDSAMRSQRLFSWGRSALIGILPLASLLGIGLLTAACAPPQQPRSPLKYRPAHLVEWVWSGALGSRSIEIRAKLVEGIDSPVLRLSTSEKHEPEGRYPLSAYDEKTRVATFELSNLKPETDYFYALESHGELDLTRAGRFRTMAEGPFSFTLAFGNCARTGSNAAIFDTILLNRPLFFLHLGDLHYASVVSRDAAPYRQALDHVLASPAQARLYREVPIVYVWDDHDFGANNSDRENPGSRAVREAYRQYVPHYPLALGDGEVPIAQSFQVGRVLFLVTDGRSARDSAKSQRRSMLGAEQRAWLKKMFAEAEDFPLTIWVNNSTWIAPAARGADDWGGFEDERRELARSISDNLASKLIMLCGDAHMLALDDGTHSDYSDQPQSKGFPVFHAAPLDQEAHVRGGPFTLEPQLGLGFFGMVEVEDQGAEVRVTLSGRDWADREMASLSFRVEQRTEAHRRVDNREPAG